MYLHVCVFQYIDSKRQKSGTAHSINFHYYSVPFITQFCESEIFSRGLLALYEISGKRFKRNRNTKAGLSVLVNYD
jgi:hypothetical protein